jgi:hypothetical protein
MIEYSKKTTHVDDDILMDELFQLGQHPRVEAAIIAFHKWVDKTRSVQTFAHCSVRTEWSLNSEMDGVWVHHHVTQSSPITTSRGPPLFAPSFEKWMYKNKMFNLIFNAARGRHSSRATIRLHAYCLFAKRGASLLTSNVSLGKDFVVDSGYVLEQWKVRKICHGEAIKQLLLNRCDNGRFTQMIERVSRLEREGRQQVEQGALKTNIALAAKPFKSYPEVNLFKARMIRAIRRIEDRSPCLIIVGPSMYGKSAFARSIYTNPHVVSCQGITEPNLSGLDAEKHNCVILEELDVDVMTTNKELFQRNSNGVRLKQSKTGMFSEWYYLHGMPFVGTTNHWPASRAESSLHWDWLEANVIVLRLTEKTWIE